MALKVLCSSFFGRHLPLMKHLIHNTIWNSIIKYFLFQFPTFCYKIQKYVEETMCCIGFGPSHDVLQELLEVEQCWRRQEDEETNNHERTTWRLRTPTICRRSVPTKCNAGLPKKKTLQPGKINKKTNQIVLMSTMPRKNILSCYLMKDYL